MRLGVVLNRNAAGGRARRVGARIGALVDDLGAVRETRTPEDLARAVEEFAAAGCEIVASCGGDGTNLSTITQVIHRWPAVRPDEPLPRIALLRGGTVNTIASNLGVAGRPDEILARLVAALRGGPPLREIGQDLLEVNGMYGFLFAAGMGARFLEVYYGGLVQGPLWAGALAARTALSALVQGRFARWLFAPVECELSADGERLDLDAVRLLLAAVVPDVGIGMRVTWRGGAEPGRFHLVASGLSTPAMALQLDRVLAGRPLRGQPHIDRLAARLDVRFARPQTFTLDGELFREREVHIAVGPRVRVLVP